MILTFSDLHGQLEPFVTEKDNQTIKVGGLAGIASVVKTIRNLNKDKTLLFSTGDSLTGNFFLQFEGEAIFSALSLLGIDASALGNHEFDRGEETLAKALTYLDFPIIQSNLESADNSSLSNRFLSYKIIEKNNLKIGIIGLMTPDLSFISNAGEKIKVHPDIVESAISTIKALKQKEDPDLIIALSHIGLEEDIKLATKVPEIDLICGGHSHDLMKKEKETVISHADGKKTIIVHPGARGEFMGILSLTVENRNITRHLWDPIRITGNIEPEKEMRALITSYKKQLPGKKVLAFSKEALDCRAKTLRTQEAAAGNLIADIIREQFKTDIAFQNGGGLRGDRIIPSGNITTEDIDLMLPFENNISILTLTGSEIKQVLEQSVSLLPLAYGGFLQVSGLRFDVDIIKTPFKRTKNSASEKPGITHTGNRVANIEILNKDRKYEPLAAEKKYSVALNSFLASGGDGYVILKNRKKKSTYTVLRSIVKNRLNRMKQISVSKETRIDLK